MLTFDRLVNLHDSPELDFVRHNSGCPLPTKEIDINHFEIVKKYLSAKQKKS
jgi:hypothetical protein